MNYYLTKNDIIKLGRLKFNIIEDSLYSGDKKFELNIPENASFINKQNSKQKAVFDLVKNVQCLKKENTEENILCRICYLEEDDRINNPMVHLCNCKGGINYAHFNCIKHWMRTKLMILINKKQTVKTYYIPRFNCEICKKPYPFRFKLDGNENKIFELIDIERPKCNYIIMESLDQVKENNNNKYINVIKIINENDITIGRGIDADIKINDISVSRFHCRLNFNFSNKSLVLTDLKSKFGTLVLIQDSFELKEKDNLIMQSGRTLIKAEVKEKKKIFACKKVNEDKKSKNEKVVKNSFINKQLKGGNKIIINFEDNMKKNLDSFLFAKLEKNMGKKLIEKESKDNSIDMDLEINA
jgi:pSer/pThr/pTyr-binding forkhead associated (FHA) protein